MKHTCTYFFVLLTFFTTNAQQTFLAGVVRDIDSREPLIGATLKAGNSGTATDVDGRFRLQVEAGEIQVQISYIGYKTKTETFTVADGKKNDVTINLESSALQLREVVSSSQYKKNLARETVTMEVVSRDQIRNTNSNDLGEVVSKTPGVLVQDGQISIRGGSSYSYGVGTRTAVMVDNLNMTSADLGEGQNKMVPVENVKQVEVIKGAASVVYGSSALNGVVNVITDWPTDTRPSTEIEQNVVMYDNPKPAYMKWWSASQPFGSITNVLHQRKVGNTQVVVGGNVTGIKSYLESNDEFRIRAYFKTRYISRAVEGLSFGINGSIMRETSERFFIAQDLDSNSLREAAGSNDRYLKTSIDPHLTYQNEKGHRYTLLVRYLNLYREGNGEDPNALSNSLEVQNQYQYKFKDLFVLTTGLPVSFGVSSSNLFPGRRTNFAGAAFAQGELNYKILSLTAGLRYEAIAVDTFWETSKPVFRSGINIQAARATFLRASWGQAYRIPAIGERFVSAEFTNGIYVIPNPDLLTESGWSLEFGLRQGFKIKNWTAFFDFATFWQEYKNFVEYQLGVFNNVNPDGSLIYPNSPLGKFGVIGLSPSNVENARIFGYELGFASQGKIGEVGLNILAGYTYTYPGKKSSDTTETGKFSVGGFLRDAFNSHFKRIEGQDTSKILIYRMRHLFRADIEMSYKKFSIGTTLFYGSFPEKIPDLFVAAAAFIFTNPATFDQFVASRQQGDFVADLRAGYDFTDKIRLGFIVKNVGNRVYSLRPGRIEPIRNYTVQLRFRF